MYLLQEQKSSRVEMDCSVQGQEDWSSEPVLTTLVLPSVVDFSVENPSIYVVYQYHRKWEWRNISFIIWLALKPVTSQATLNIFDLTTVKSLIKFLKNNIDIKAGNLELYFLKNNVGTEAGNHKHFDGL